MLNARLIAALLSAGTAMSVGAQVATFTPLGDLPGGNFVSEARGLAPDGLAVVGHSRAGAGTEAARWILSRNGSVYVVDAMEGLGFLSDGYRYSVAEDITDDGHAVFGGSSYTVDSWGQPAAEAFRWTRDTGMLGLGFPPGSGTLPQSFAQSCSADGAVLGGYGNNQSPTVPIRWRDGLWSFADSGGDPRPMGQLRSLSSDGSVGVGFEREGADSLYFVVWIGDEPAARLFLGQGVSVSRNGLWGAGMIRDDSGARLAVLVPIGSGAQTLGTPAPGLFTTATAVADHGRVAAVRTGSAAESMEPWLWDRYSGAFIRMIDALEGYGLDLAGWDLTQIADMDADGRVLVGFGFNPAGDVEAFHASIPYACPGDHDRDGSIDTRDIIAFLNDWAGGLRRADTDNDGVVDSRDCLFLLERWRAGC